MLRERAIGLGIFVSPVHSPHLDPTWTLNNDIHLIETADRLGFDEAWVGEHRSTGWSTLGHRRFLSQTLSLGRTASASAPA
jgi:limonene 1,2-monooxygenase